MSLIIGNGIAISLTPGGIDFVWSTLTGPTTLAVNQGYFLDYGIVPTQFNVTLPSTPSEGDVVVLLHVRGDVDLMAQLPMILQGVTGEKINELDEDMDIDVNYELFTFVYSGIASIGWRTV